MSWSPQSIADLRRHWADGKTATEIAKEMGLTRSMVLAKARRLGLARKTGSEDERFEALIEIVASADLNRPVAVTDAAKRVGIPIARATELWKAFAARYGEQDIARRPDIGDRLVAAVRR